MEGERKQIKSLNFDNQMHTAKQMHVAALRHGIVLFPCVFGLLVFNSLALITQRIGLLFTSQEVGNPVQNHQFYVLTF